MIVEAATFDEYKNQAGASAVDSGVTEPQQQPQSFLPSDDVSVNSAVQPEIDPNRDSFLDWISAFLKPNQPSSPVLPIGDPPENCPPCGK